MDFKNMTPIVVRSFHYDLNDEQMIQLFNKNIKLIPKLYVDGSVLNYLIILIPINYILNGA